MTKSDKLPNDFKSLIVRKNSFNKCTVHLEKTQLKNVNQNEIVIKVFYSSLNYKDILVCNGTYWDCRNYPVIPGIDAAGIVIKSYSKKFKRGNKVIVIARPAGSKHPGGLSQYLKVPSEWADKLPNKMSLKESMIFGTAGFTAALAIHKLLRGGIKRSNLPILVSGATGGVGVLSIYMLSKLGFRVCASTGKPNKKKFLRKIGADEVLDRNQFKNISDLSLQKIRYAAIIDSVGGDIISLGSRQLAVGGKIISLGMMSKPNCNLNLTPFILRGIEIIGLHTESSTSALRKFIWKKISKFSKDSELKNLYRECKLSNVKNSIKKFGKNTRIGRIIVRID